MWLFVDMGLTRRVSSTPNPSRSFLFYTLGTLFYCNIPIFGTVIYYLFWMAG